MTREEAIRLLKTYRNCLFGILTEPIDMAIKALEQEPIDKSAIMKVALERYEDLCEYFGGSEAILKNRDEFKAWLDRVKWHIRKAEELYEKYEQKPLEVEAAELQKAYNKGFEDCRQTVADLINDQKDVFYSEGDKGVC